MSQDGSGSGIYGQEVKTNGDMVGPEFRVNTYTNGDQQHPAVSDDRIGGYVVGWNSHLQDGDQDGVYFQRFVYSDIPEFSHLALVISATMVIFIMARRRISTRRY